MKPSDAAASASPAGRRAGAGEPLLAVRDLHAYYGKSHVLHGVDLHIRKGEIVSLLGNPELIMIDEPTEGLAPKIVELVASYLQELKARGIAVLLIEQKLAIALEISERIYIMGHGSIVFEGTPAQLADAAAVRREWLEV